jgi:hypothetical protein
MENTMQATTARVDEDFILTIREITPHMNPVGALHAGTHTVTHTVRADSTVEAIETARAMQGERFDGGIVTNVAHINKYDS